jgi:hypothetical protein
MLQNVQSQIEWLAPSTRIADLQGPRTSDLLHQHQLTLQLSNVSRTAATTLPFRCKMEDATESTEDLLNAITPSGKAFCDRNVPVINLDNALLVYATRAMGRGQRTRHTRCCRQYTDA